MRKVHFPRLAIPLSVVLTTYLNFVLNFVAVIVFVLASGMEPRWSWLKIVPLILGLGVLVRGHRRRCCRRCSCATATSPRSGRSRSRSRSTASPILYPIEKIPNESLQHLIMCNPLAAIVEQARHAIIDPTAPSAAQAIGGAI